MKLPFRIQSTSTGIGLVPWLGISFDTCTASLKLFSSNSETPFFVSELFPCIVDGSMFQQHNQVMPITSQWPNKLLLINLQQPNQVLPISSQQPNQLMAISLQWHNQLLLIYLEWSSQVLPINLQQPNQVMPINS